MEFLAGEDEGKKDNDVVWDSLAKVGIANIDTYTDDEPFGMTNGRAIARYLSRFRWYYPAGGDNGSASEEATEETGLLPDSTKKQAPKADLDLAWYYYEHMVLPRRFCTEDGHKIESAVGSVKAPAGEADRPNKLYSPLHTTMHELADFGIGIGLYFSMLRGIAIIMLVAAIIHIPNFMYYSSSDYSMNGQSAVKTLLRGSAICTDTEWVPCPTCKRVDNATASQFDFPDISNIDGISDLSALADMSAFTEQWKEELWSESKLIESEDGLVFGLKNKCGEGDEDYLYSRGIVTLVGTTFIVIALLAFGEYQRKLSVEFDERNATATDFSIEIKNPPKDAVDADEWKAYLELVARTYLKKNGSDALGGTGAPITERDFHVTCLTVAVNNQDLIDALVARRRVKKGIVNALDLDAPAFDDLYARVSKPDVDLGAADLGKAKGKMKKLLKLDKKIEVLQEQTYDAKRVFISMETEIGQRAILTALSVSRIAIAKNKKTALDDEAYLFRGNRVMDAEEPPEPLTVRYHDIGVPKKEKRNKRFIAMLLSILVVIGAFLLVRHMFLTYGAGISALFIAILNILTPLVCRGITGIEVHSDEGGKQASHSVKVLGLRCVNSAVIIHLVTPFTMSLTSGEHLVKAVCAIFIAEMFTAPIVQALFIPGIIKMHIVAPRCKDQDSMNQCFSGMKWELGERYTNIMKVLFLCFFFSSIFPGAFALSSLLLFIHYEMDKFCLFRVWGRVGSIGGDVAEQNRSYIVPGLLVLLACMNAYAYSAFPYDDLCLSSDSLPDEYVGEHTLLLPKDFEDESATFSVQAGDDSYYACDQDFLNFPIVFPPLPMFQGDDHWMTPGQEAVVTLHCWTSFVVIGIALLYIFFLSSLAERIKGLFVGTYEPSGVLYGTDFSDVPGDVFEAYVPQITAKGFLYPLIACDIRGLDSKFIGWKDEDGDHSEHVLFDDLAPQVTGNTDKPIFSIMKHWSPPGSAANSRAGAPSTATSSTATSAGAIIEAEGSAKEGENTMKKSPSLKSKLIKKLSPKKKSPANI